MKDYNYVFPKIKRTLVINSIDNSNSLLICLLFLNASFMLIALYSEFANECAFVLFDSLFDDVTSSLLFLEVLLIRVISI